MLAQYALTRATGGFETTTVCEPRSPSTRGESAIGVGKPANETRRKALRPRSARFERGSRQRSGLEVNWVGPGTGSTDRRFSSAPQGAGESRRSSHAGALDDVEKRQRTAAHEVKAAPAEGRGWSVTRGAARRRSPMAQAGTLRTSKSFGRNRVSLVLSVEAGAANSRTTHPRRTPREGLAATEGVHNIRRCAARVVCTLRTRPAKSARST